MSFVLFLRAVKVKGNAWHFLSIPILASTSLFTSTIQWLGFVNSVWGLFKKKSLHGVCLCVFRRGKFMKCQLRYNGGNVTCLLVSNTVTSGNSFLAITPQCTAVTRNVASHVCQCFTQWCKIFASEVLPEEPAANVPWYFHVPVILFTFGTLIFRNNACQ